MLLPQPRRPAVPLAWETLGQVWGQTGSSKHTGRDAKLEGNPLSHSAADLLEELSLSLFRNQHRSLDI